jgi:hypothetical protein
MISRRLAFQQHLPLLLIGLAVPLIALGLDVLEGEKICVRGFAGAPLPDVCFARRLGVPCLACGLTRSIVLLMHGDIAGSLAMHRFGWLIFGLIVAQVPYRLWRLARPETPVLASPRLEYAFWGGLVALLVLNRAYDAWMSG